MLRVFFDIETFYDRRTYTLSKMSPIEYLLDDRFELLGMGIAIEHEAPMVLKQEEGIAFLRNIKQPYCLISHNATFDACAMAYRYGIHPDGLLCTLSMARATLLHQIPNGKLSLKNILKYLGFTPKGDFINDMSGKHFSDLQTEPGLMTAWAGYTVNDVEGCRNIFFHLAPTFPRQEAMVLDRLIRMATQPKLHVNMLALGDYVAALMAKQQELLASVNQERTALMSNNQLAELLTNLGIDPPTKPSPTNPEKMTWAFAKTDAAFNALLEHDDPDVQALVAARLGVKSTIEQTRSIRLINIGSCATQFLGEPLLPCPLRYSGAHTHRYSGDWQLNMQNLSARKSREIRSAILAPPGYTIVAVDAAQIEARLTAWLAGQMDLLQQFANGDDVYRNFAADIFRCNPDGVTKVQRFIGKTCILGLGFGMSARKLLLTIVNLARDQAIDVSWITQEMCDDWVNVYRTRFRAIKQYWYTMTWVLGQMMNGQADGMAIGPCVVEGTTIIGPGGLRLYYHNLHSDENQEYWYKYGQFPKKIYGGKVTENVVQHLDRQHVVEAGINTELRAREYGIPDPRVLLNVHDENVHCVPDEYAEQMALTALGEMRRNAPWSEGLPLNAEVKMGKNFGEMEEWKP